MIKVNRTRRNRLRLLAFGIVMVISATMTQAQSPALCNDWNFVEGAQIRAEFGEYRYEANCKLINPRNTGIMLPSVDVTQMVNVFYPEHDMPFANGGVLCLRGNNELLFTTGPDQPVFQLDMYRVEAWPEYICTTIYETGYVLRTRNRSGVPAIPRPSPPIEQQQCQVTTRSRLRLRAEPTTSSPILSVLPANLTQLSDQRIQRGGNWWFRVPPSLEHAETGWLSGDFLLFEGDCGYSCEQEAAGTRIICRIR